MMAVLQTEPDVLAHTRMGEEREVLRDHADSPTFRRSPGAGTDSGLSIDLDVAPIWSLKAGEHSQRRRLPASAGSKECDDFASLDGERQVMDGNGIAERLADVAGGQAGIDCC